MARKSILYIGIFFILIGGIVTSFFAEEGFVEIKKGQTVEGIYVEDDVYKKLDFSIYLSDFNVEYYPEKKIIRGYKTVLAVNGKEGVIQVNKPLSHSGYKIYQYGYDEAMPDQTLLQVVKDPGYPIVCLGYGLLLLGIIVSYPSLFKVGKVHLLAVIFLWLIFASLFFIRVRFPMVPALRSRWLVSHVSSVFIAYANFAFAFVLSIIGLFKKKKEALLSLTHNSICLGFVFLTIGIIIGSVWAKSAWGHWWGWDPKETWALVTWIIYGIYFIRRGLPPFLFGIFGFLAVLFNYLGVTYLMKGLHSYG